MRDSWVEKEFEINRLLVGLWRAHFFEHAAFYEGTTLRILKRSIQNRRSNGQGISS
jgi:hypothetical protein